jgi:hypothetical protein
MSDITIDTAALGEKIVRVLKTIYDPEIQIIEKIQNKQQKKNKTKPKKDTIIIN